MSTQDFDLTVDLKKHINEPFNQYYEKAKAASDGGKLKLVSEKLCQPYEGDGFVLKKGQIIRYELTHGPQVLDTMYLVKSRPNDEWACTYHSSHFGGQTLYEGMHYFSNTPYARPLLTFVRDTVDGEKIIKDFGKSAGHSFVYNSGRCTLGTLERIFRIPHCNCCDSNMLKGIVDVAGEKVARGVKIPQAFMHFQVVNFESIPTNLTYYPAGRFGDYFNKNDYVELLAHDDLYVGVSPCPIGDQNERADFRKMTCYPFRVSIWEGADAPLETAPDPGHGSSEVVDWIMAGRPGMVHGKIGEEQF
jgi:uncharacterized protein YcgI (DUF1989 family)